MHALQGLLSLTGRVLLCAIFLMSAIGNKIPKFNALAEVMAGKGVPEPKIMLAGATVFLIVGSISVILGYKARFGALLLAIFLGLASYYFHNFWTLDPASKEFEGQMVHFMKNLSIFGGTLFIMANGPGAWSLDTCCKPAVPRP